MVNMVPRRVSNIRKPLGTIIMRVPIVATVSTHKSIKCHPIFSFMRIRELFLAQLRCLRCHICLFFVQRMGRLSLIPTLGLFWILLKHLDLFLEIGIVFFASMQRLVKCVNLLSECLYKPSICITSGVLITFIVT